MAFEDELVQQLRQLVRLPSFSGQEQLVADAVEAKLHTMDFDAVWRDEFGNVIGQRQGGLPGGRIAFDAHMDIVDLGDRAAWQHDPLGGELSGGRIWGRGATDTKASLAGMMIGLGRMPRKEIAGTVYVVASVGEEKIEGAALAHALQTIQPQGVVIGEPSECRLGIGQKGRAGLWLEIAGRSAHSSSPHLGENAVYRAAEAVQHIRQIPMREDADLGSGVMELIEIISSPYPGESTVPFGCRIRYDRRLVQGETRESVLADFSQALAGLERWQVGFQPVRLPIYTGKELNVDDFHPAWMMKPGSAWVQQAQHSLGAVGLNAEPWKAPYCTNGSYSAGIAGLPTLIFGPSAIRLAHIVDEYIEVDELVRGMQGFCSLARRLGAVV